jgi:hypothetical protein
VEEKVGKKKKKSRESSKSFWEEGEKGKGEKEERV